MMAHLKLHIDQHVAEVVFNRPDKRNALDLHMFEEIAAVGMAIRQNPAVRAVVIYGAGKVFCGGIDLASLADSDGNHLSNLRDRTHGVANLFQNAAMQWRDMPVPVIAGIHGCALGGGLQIALGADIRIAAPDTMFSMMEILWGLVPDMGGTVLADGLIRKDALCELTYTGRTFDGVEALQLGLVTRLADQPIDAARALARQIAASSPAAIKAAKRLLHAPSEASIAARLMAEAVEQQALLGASSQREAMAARLAKRTPKFDD